MNFTEKLKEILEWIASHSSRLSRKGLDLPNHLANARVYFFDKSLAADVPTSTILLDAHGRLQGEVMLGLHKTYRLEVRDVQEVILFTEDDIST